MKPRVLIFVLTMCLPSWGATYYVLAGGTGTHNGTDWANANCKIPNPLAAGDVVYIGNSGGNLADATTTCAGEATHTFTGSGTSSNHITIKAATGADHGTGTGWNSSYGVDVTPKITWSNSFTINDGLKQPFLLFCGNYYDIDGEVGSADQTGTYGFYMKSGGNMFGFIKVDSHDCSENSLSNITIRHLEIDGVTPASSVVLGTGTVNVSGTAVTWVSGTQFSSAWTGNQATLNGLVVNISSVSDSTHMAISGNLGTLNGTLASYTSSGASGLYLGSPVSTTATVQNISFSYGFIHSIFGMISSAGNVTGLTVANSYLYDNFSDAAQHANALDANPPARDGTLTALSNLDFHQNVLRNIMGTGNLMCLTGICDSWRVYSNVSYYTSDWDTICDSADPFATCGISKFAGDNNGSTCPGACGIVTNSQFFGNTIANIHLKSGHAGADEAGLVFQMPGSTGNLAQDNLWWNCTRGTIFQDGANGNPARITHDYNTWLNTGYAAGVMALATHDFQVGTAPGGVAANPFVNSFGDLQLSSETVDPHLNDGTTLASPYNLDLVGNTRGADGTWERGAYEFDSSNSVKPNAPTNLTVISIQ